MTEGMIITYETLFDLLRREKSRDELQQLDPEFYKNVHTYLQEKHKLLGNDSEGFMDESEKTRIQIANIKKIVKELYERRERKVVNLALFKSRVKNKVLDTRALLPEEHILCESILDQLTENRDVVLTTLLNNMPQTRTPEVAETNTPKPIIHPQTKARSEPSLSEQAVQQKDSPQQSAPVSNRESDRPKPAQDPEPADTEPAEKPQPFDTPKKIKFTNAVPKFLGTELEVYGPYEEEDVADLPGKIADVLIQKGRAEEVAK